MFILLFLKNIYINHFFYILFTRNIICLKLACLRKTRYIFTQNLFLCIDRDYRVFSHTIVLSVTNPDLTNEKCDESIPIEDNPMRPEGDLQQHQLPNDRIMGLFHISWAVSNDMSSRDEKQNRSLDSFRMTDVRSGTGIPKHFPSTCCCLHGF